MEIFLTFDHAENLAISEIYINEIVWSGPVVQLGQHGGCSHHPKQVVAVVFLW